MKILVVEDDLKIATFLEKGLKEEGHNVDIINNGIEALYLIEINKYNLILLDIMIPGIDGITLCKQCREKNINTPIIMLTAKDSIEDRITGLDIGANDYLSKPFSFRELLARIRVQLRDKIDYETILKLDGLELNLLTKTAKREDENISLTAKEFTLLEYLMRNKNRVLSETMIADALNSFDDAIISNIVNVYIYRLRNKIDKKFDKKLINTIRGLGFCMSDKE